MPSRHPIMNCQKLVRSREAADATEANKKAHEDAWKAGRACSHISRPSFTSDRGVDTRDRSSNVPSLCSNVRRELLPLTV